MSIPAPDGLKRPSSSDEPTLTPYIAPATKQREFTLRAVLLGLFMSLLFNAANAYVGLKIGLTISASIPSAVISMALLRKLLPRAERALGWDRAAPGTILENNVVHTIASSGEALAAGIIFTLPSFFFLTATAGPSGYPIGGQLPTEGASFLYGTLGGALGILAMIPLRHYMTVQEHRNLPYPEGLACAKVLIAGDAGGVNARPVFAGIAMGGVGKLLMSGLGLFRESAFRAFPSWHKASIGFEATPLLAGVGYLIGARVAAVMLAGSLLGSLVLVPLIDWLGQNLDAPLGPASLLIREMNAGQLRSSYVKYIGAGGVAMGGAISLVRTLPSALSSVRSSLRALARARAAGADVPRTERDIPIRWVLVGIGLVAIAIGSLPSLHSAAWGIGTVMGLTALTVVFAFFFVAVSARIVGLVGTTSQPVSGMTITAVLASSFAIAALGHTGVDARLAAMTVGALVCVSICLAGDMAQDLKTGALVGATPWCLQLGQLIGTTGAALRAGFILWLLHKAYHLGSPALAAPQADLMAHLVEGVMGGKLPWVLLLVGASIGGIVELCGVSALAFSIGLYLPVATWPPIFVGGLVSWWVKRTPRAAAMTTAAAKPAAAAAAKPAAAAAAKPAAAAAATVEERHERGTLFASGLVAGDALMGIGVSMLAVAADRMAARTGGGAWTVPLTKWSEAYGSWNDIVPLLVFGTYVVCLAWVARPARHASSSSSSRKPTPASP